MKTCYTVTLAMLAGAALGAAGVSGLKAQGKPPGAYAIFAYSEISDPDAFQKALTKAPSAIKDSGGRLIVRAEKFTVLREGTTPFPLKRYVIIAFDSVQQAQAWHDSPVMKEVDATVER